MILNYIHGLFIRRVHNRHQTSRFGITEVVKQTPIKFRMGIPVSQHIPTRLLLSAGKRGDTVIICGSTVAQIKNNVDACRDETPLPKVGVQKSAFDEDMLAHMFDPRMSTHLLPVLRLFENAFSGPFRDPAAHKRVWNQPWNNGVLAD